MVTWLLDFSSVAGSLGWVPTPPFLPAASGLWVTPRSSTGGPVRTRTPVLDSAERSLRCPWSPARQQVTRVPTSPQQPVAPTELPLAGSPNSAVSCGTQIMYLSVQTHVLLMADKMLINFTDCSFLRQVRKLDPQLSVRALV